MAALPFRRLLVTDDPSDPTAKRPRRQAHDRTGLLGLEPGRRRSSPLPLLGEGGRSEWNKDRPGEGCVTYPSPGSLLADARNSPLSHSGRGKHEYPAAHQIFSSTPSRL